MGIGVLAVTAYALFLWGVFVSPNTLFLLAALSLTLSLFNSVAILTLWVFYLAKQFSTHSVKVLDIKQSVRAKKPVVKTDFEEEDEEEKRIKDFATSTTAAMFSRTKEKLTDSLL